MSELRPARRRHRDLRTVLLTLVVSSTVMATPTIAAEIVNADTVDGRHAVGATATVAQRKGKLVATGPSGFLPGGIVQKVPDSDRLDGRDSADYVTKTASRGSVQTGLYTAWSGSVDTNFGDEATFRGRLPVKLPPSRVQFIAFGAATTAQCPGVGQVVPLGWLCVYEGHGANHSDPAFFQPDVSLSPDGVSSRGFGIGFTCLVSPCFSHGSYAVKAGDAADVRGASGPRS